MSAGHFDMKMLEAARGGDQYALLSLLSAAQPDIRRYAKASCKKTDDIDDAVQETLWLLSRRVGTLRALTSFSGWLFAVVRRECSRLARKMLGQHTPIEDIENNSHFSHRSSADLRIDLCQAIQSLPDHYRDVVVLRDIQEMTIDEIAATLHQTRESVKARLHRARGMIREYLNG